MRPISWRKARPLQRRVRRLAAGDRLPPACADHTTMVSHGTISLSFESHSAQDHTLHNGQRTEPTPHTIRPNTTDSPHHERSNHTGTTSRQHHGHSYHHSITGTPTTSTCTTGNQDGVGQTSQKGYADHIPWLPNGLPVSRRERCRNLSKC